jgi:hypothetical protein
VRLQTLWASTVRQLAIGQYCTSLQAEELLRFQWHARTFFGGANQILVFGANTYRMVAHYAAQLQDDPNFASLSAAP